MFSTSWAMKRVYKFLLKRLLGKLLVNEIDLEQLEVQLGAGTLELRDLLLDTNYLNAQLGEAAAVTISTGYIGTIKATVPWKGLASQPIEIDIDELEITVAPRTLAPPSGDEQCDPQSSSEPEGMWPSEEQPGSPDTADPLRLQAYAGVDDGVRVIARLVESILLGLRVRVMRLVIRVEHKSTAPDGPADVSDCALVVRVPFAEYKDETPVASMGASGGWGFLGGSLAGGLGWGADAPSKEPTVMKTVSFKGVEVALERPAGARSHQAMSGVLLSGANGGADGSVRVSMHWKSGAKGSPKLDLELLARPLEVRVDLADVSTLSTLAAAFPGGKASGSGEKGFVARGLVQKERALHELAGSGLLAPAGVRDNPTGVNGSPNGGFRARKEDLLQSQYFSQQQAEDLRRSIGAGDGWVSEFGDAPGWLKGGEGGAEEEADLAASVDDFFDCLNGTASGHLSRSSHSGRRSVSWASPSETPSEAFARRKQRMAEVSAESPSAELNRPGVRQAQGSSPSRQSLPDLNPSFDPHLTNDEPGTSAVASYSARAKIAGVKIILLAPVEKRKRTGPDRCKGGAETRAPLGGGSGERSEMAGAVKAEELGQQVTEVAQESGRRREDSGSFAGSDFRMGRGLVGSQAAAVRGEGEGREQPGALTGEATTFGSKLQAKRQTECVEFHRRLIVDKSPIRSSSAESLQSAEENRFEQGSKSLGVAAQAAAGLEEDDFSDALDYEETDGQDSADNGASAIPMHAKFPGRGWGVDDVSNGDSGSRDEFGSANDVQRLENDWLGGIGTRGPEPPCEIVEREWSPEPTEHEAIELRTNVADFSGGRSTGPNAGGVHVGKSSGGLDPREVSGGWNGGEVALEMPLDNESEEEDGYGMRPAEPQMASVFGRESLLAWSGAGSEHWNGGYETEDVAGSASYPPEKEWDREGLGFATLEDRGVLRDEGTANPAEEELSGADSPGTAEYELKGQEEAGEELESPRDYLEAVCTGLSFSVAVSASSTSIEIASDTLEIAEVLHSPQVLELGSRLDVARDSAMPPRESAHKLTPRERRLQQVEAALPSPYGAPQPFTRSGSQTRTFPFAVSSSFSTNGNAPDAPLLSEQLSMSERRKLVKVRSGPPITKPAVAVSVLISPGGSTGRVDGGPNHARGKALGRQSSLLGHADPAPRDTPSTEVKAELQPVTLFLDLSLPERLKRFAPVSGGPATPVPAVTPVPLLRASQVLPSPRRSFEDFLPSQVLPRPGSSPVDDIIDDLDRQLSGSDAGLLRSAEAQQGALSITVSSSCFRTILSFPEENDSIDKDAAKKPTSRPNVGAPYRGDFLALDLFSGSSPNDQPAFLSYKIEPPELYLRRSFSSAPSPEPESSVCLGAADLGFYLVTDSYFTTGGSAQAPGYRAFSLLSVSKQPGPPSRQKPPWKPARLSSPVDESGLGVSLDVRMRPAAESGDWLAQLAWDATSAQKTRGDGGSGVDNNQHGETAAARASAADEDLIALEIREKAMGSSATCVQLSLDHASVEVVRWRLERLGQLLEAVKQSSGTGSEEGVENGVNDGFDGHAESRLKEEDEGRKFDQFAFLLNMAALELRLFDEGGPKGRAKGPPGEEPDAANEKDEWASFRGEFSEFTFFHVSNLGGATENSYMWIRHERCGLYGTLQSPTPPESGAANGGSELLLLTCSNEVLGRGDAGDENALASPGTVGLTVSVISYPSGGFETDSIVACSLRGGTVMAPMGRLDWVLALKELTVGAGSDAPEGVKEERPTASESVGTASRSAEKASESGTVRSESVRQASGSATTASESNRPASESVYPASETYVGSFSSGKGFGGETKEGDNNQAWPPSVTSSVDRSKSRSSQASGSTNRTCFLLDLHDLALCYEPNAEPNPQKPLQNQGKSTPPDSRPSLSRQNSSSNVGSSVSAVLAVAALRVSSVLGKQMGGSERGEEEGGETVQEQVFDVWLRDAALLILDNAMRRPAGGDFTTSSLAQAGFVQVAREGVLEACIRTHTEEGLQWELDCTHNQLRLDTCQDTTAALGRLAGQIQALIQADMEPVAVAGGGAVIHRQFGDQDPAELLRTLSEGSQDSGPPSLSSSLAAETFRSTQTERQAGGTTRASREEGNVGDGAKSGFARERHGAGGGWEGEIGARRQSESYGRGGISEKGYSRALGECLTDEVDGTEFLARRGRAGGPAEFTTEFSHPSSFAPNVGDTIRPGGTHSSPGGTRETQKEAGALPDFIENFYEGLDGRAPPVKPGSGESFHTVPPSHVKQPIWTGDPVGVNTPRTQRLFPEEASNSQVPTRPRKPVSLSSPSVNRRKAGVKEHDASWFDGKMPPLSEDYVVRPSGSPPKEDLGRPWLRNRRPGGSKSRGSLPRKYPKPVGRLLLRDLSVRWRLYGGRDWGYGTETPEYRSTSGSRAGSTSGLRQGGANQRSGGGVHRPGGGLVTRSVKPTEDGLEGWSTVSVEPGAHANDSPQVKRGAFPGAIHPPGRGGRQKENCLEVLLDGVDLQHDSFPQRDHYASRLAVSVRDITVYDFSKSAPWRMIMGHYRSASCPRESGSKALRVEMDAVRPNPASLLEEYRLLLALLPLRLHLDQRHIDFCADFFAGGGSAPSSPGDVEAGGGGVAKQEGDGVDEAFLPFFQMFEMRLLTIRVDYLPRRIDLLSLRGGNYAELLNLVTWEGVELRLKGVRCAGVHGWDGLGAVLMNEWVEDISQHQLNKIVRGVAPIRPLYEVGRATAQLLVLPAEQYKKDKRLLKGLRKGAAAFLKGVSLEALGLGAQLAAGAHELLQQAEATLSGDLQTQTAQSPSAPNGSPLHISQPHGTREGLKQAFDTVSRGFERSASGVISAPIKRYQRSGSAGKAVATALRAAPAAVVAPAAATAGAVHRALLGVRNELDPERKREIDEKHAAPPPDGRRRS